MKAATKSVAASDAGMDLQPGIHRDLAAGQKRRKEEAKMSNNISNSSKQSTIQKLSTAATGVTNEFPATTKLQLAGQTYTPAQVASVFSAAATAVDAVAPVKAQLQQLVASQGTALKTATALYIALKKYVESVYGKGNPELAAFGFSTALPQQPSSETKALAQAKAKLTRQARGTVGPRQKQAVTSNGSPGLVFVGANGQAVPGVTQGPTPPASPASGSTSSK